MARLEIKLIRSTIGCKKDQIATIEALGLRKIGSIKVFNDTPQIRGMVKKVSHLIIVNEI